MENIWLRVVSEFSSSSSISPSLSPYLSFSHRAYLLPSLSGSLLALAPFPFTLISVFLSSL